MNAKELNRHHFIRKAVEGEMTVAQAAENLGLTTRRVKQLKKAFRLHGPSALIHGNALRPSCRKTDPALVERILLLRNDSVLCNSNFTHFGELLFVRENISIPYSTLRNILVAHGFTSPKTRRSGHTVHATRERKPAIGMMLQTDASPFDWLGNGEALALHGLIDDATGQVTGLYLCRNECLLGYLEATRQTLTNHGIPQSLYSDRSGVFFVNPAKDGEPSIEEQLAGQEVHLTQFGRIMQRLGVEMIKAYSPEAKGRIERLWGTLQSRLPIEFALRDIKTVEQANTFLLSYIPVFNQQFAIQAAQTYSAFVPLPHTEDLDRLLCVVLQRRLCSGSTISIKNVSFRIDQNRFPAKTPVTVLLSEKHGLRALISGQFYPIHPIDPVTHAADVVRTGDMPRVVVELLRQFLLKDAKVA